MIWRRKNRFTLEDQIAMEQELVQKQLDRERTWRLKSHEHHSHTVEIARGGGGFLDPDQDRVVIGRDHEALEVYVQVQNKQCNGSQVVLDLPIDQLVLAVREIAPEWFSQSPGSGDSV